jgi:hypothetical protein
MKKPRDLILLDPPTIPIGDVATVRRILVDAAKAGKAMSYAGVLDALGHRFSRPKMRALCRTHDALDQEAAAAGEPDLAVLVVRESDGLPGQGWWVGKVHEMGYQGLWTGPDAEAFVRREQKRVFDYWRGEKKKLRPKKSKTGGSGRSTSRPRAARRG